ncbi:MAG: LCP family protein [Chloroflexota bacterium]
MKKYFYILIGFIGIIGLILFISQFSVFARTLTSLGLIDLPQVSSCSGSGSMNILVIGSDYAELKGEKGSDLTRIVRVDFDNKKAAIFSFSRDLLVDTTGLGLVNPVVNSSRLGMVFYEGRIRSPQLLASDTIVDGTRISAKMLSKNFSINSDHFVSIDLNNLGTLIDSIGGLPINIPIRTTDPFIGTVIEAGQQTLTGPMLVAYARAIPDSDFGRIKRNDLIISALRAKLIDPSVLLKLPVLLKDSKSIIATDLAEADINNLICIMKEIPADSIVYDGVKPEWTTMNSDGSLSWDKQLVTERLSALGLIK